jgi:hypothetical protein
MLSQDDDFPPLHSFNIAIAAPTALEPGTLDRTATPPIQQFVLATERAAQSPSLFQSEPIVANRAAFHPSEREVGCKPGWAAVITKLTFCHSYI